MRDNSLNQIDPFSLRNCLPDSPRMLDEVILENPGIIFMEEQKSETIKEWLSFGTQLIS